MKIGDRVEILDCVYESDELCKGNFGYITEIIKPHFEDLFIVKLDSDPESDHAYVQTELKVIS